MKTQASPKKPVAKKPGATQKSPVQKKSLKAPAGNTQVGNGATTSSSPQTEEIASRAYKIWQERGCPEGFDEVHWHLAEQEILGASSPGFAS